jgi:hypothetical protein
MNNRLLKVAGLVVVLAAVFSAFVVLRRHPTKELDASECRLSVPRSTIDPMVFPTKDGSEALDAAIIGNADESAVSRVISEQGGFIVSHGTGCSTVEVGPMYSQVLVTEGPYAGKAVWAPSMHTHGK